MKTSLLRPALAALLLLAFSACSKKDPHAGHDHSAPAAPAKHAHQAPHGGTPVVLGQETYHLEFVRDALNGKLSAYVLDGEMENFIRVATPSLDLTITVAGAIHGLTLTAVANPATGEKVGDTSLFETQADWLKTTGTFDATLKKIEIRGTTYSNVVFNFPKGNDKD